MRRIGKLCVPVEVLENPLDHRRILDAGDDPQPPAAAANRLRIAAVSPPRGASP
jgi:hypothetical protein